MKHHIAHTCRQLFPTATMHTYGHTASVNHLASVARVKISTSTDNKSYFLIRLQRNIPEPSSLSGVGSRERLARGQEWKTFPPVTMSTRRWPMVLILVVKRPRTPAVVESIISRLISEGHDQHSCGQARRKADKFDKGAPVMKTCGNLACDTLVLQRISGRRCERTAQVTPPVV